MIRTIKVSEKGQIAIPQSMRDKVGISRGDDLILIEIEGKILIEKPKKISQRIKNDFKDILKFNETSLKEVWNNPKDDIWSEYLNES